VGSKDGSRGWSLPAGRKKMRKKEIDIKMRIGFEAFMGNAKSKNRYIFLRITANTFTMYVECVKI